MDYFSDGLGQELSQEHIEARQCLPVTFLCREKERTDFSFVRERVPGQEAGREIVTLSAQFHDRCVDPVARGSGHQAYYASGASMHILGRGNRRHLGSVTPNIANGSNEISRRFGNIKEKILGEECGVNIVVKVSGNGFDSPNDLLKLLPRIMSGERLELVDDIWIEEELPFAESEDKHIAIEE